jgi:hypothetical protein
MNQINKLRLLYIIDQLRNHKFKYSEDPIFEDSLYLASKLVLMDFKCSNREKLKSLDDIVESYGTKWIDRTISIQDFCWMCSVTAVIGSCLKRQFDDKSIELLEFEFYMIEHELYD